MAFLGCLASYFRVSKNKALQQRIRDIYQKSIGFLYFVAVTPTLSVSKESKKARPKIKLVFFIFQSSFIFDMKLLSIGPSKKSPPKNCFRPHPSAAVSKAVILIPQIGRSCRWPRALKSPGSLDIQGREASQLIALSDFPADFQFCQAIVDIKFDP